MLALDVSNEPIESCLPPILAQIWDTRLSCVIAEKNNHQSEEKALFFGSYLHLGRVRTASIAHSRIIYSSLLYTLSCIVLSPSLRAVVRGPPRALLHINSSETPGNDGKEENLALGSAGKTEDDSREEFLRKPFLYRRHQVLHRP